MKRLIVRSLAFLFLILCLVSFAWQEVATAAKVTGEDGTITTSEENTEKPVTKLPRPQAVKKAVETKTVEGNGEEAAPKKNSNAEEESRYVTIDFDNVDIQIFVKFISELTGQNFVIDKAVKGNVTIISPKKISVDDAYKVFESVLEVHGFTAVPAGDIVKILPSRDAKERNVETRLKEGAISPEDRVVTQIISLEYANPDEMKKVLTPLVSKSSVILSYSPTGMLVITDLLSNIKRLLTIINALDVEGIEEQISVIPLQYASAVEIAKSLSQIFQKTPQKKGTMVSPIQIVPDERTNTIIALASENDASRIGELIKLLDREVPKGEERIRVYRLQNADAEELTKVLMNLPSEKGGAKTPEKGKEPVLSKDISIVPDKATNTLIITAGRDDYNVLEDVISQLDIPRPMVYIEALIMEVNVDKGFKGGVEWIGGERVHSDSNQIVGGGFTGGGIIPTPDPTTGYINFPEGLAVGIFEEYINIGGVMFPSLGAVLQAYQKDNDVHILSTPQILTLDNEEAEIYVGENVPYQTRQETSTTDFDYSSYEYKDVGVTLKITPQISQERFVRLDIFQEVTKLVSEEDIRPTTLKRTTKTAVTIKDKNTIVIGGLIGDDISNTTYKVPLLGDIPLLGWLFKYQSESSEKRNLFIFITPHIVESPVEAKTLFEEKESEIKEVEEGVIKTYRRHKIEK
ncbi:MAG: type II secretion system secretin GspD [Deltaproteobacteria bacterium]|nr:type II secretion system secretin GspD [Deltaproteobacteria bacterium]